MTEAYLVATGKPSLPNSGSSKYNRLLSLCKKCYRDWQTEVGTDWNSLYQIVGAGTVSNTDTYDIDTDILRVSQREGDYIRIVTLDGDIINFKLVPASRLYATKHSNTVAKIGQTLKFNRVFTSDDNEFGGTIEVPAYIKLDDLENLDDDILIDNPAWLPVIVAAHYVTSDAQLSYKYPDIVAQAADLMYGMKVANGTQGDTYSTGENFFDVGLGYGEC